MCSKLKMVPMLLKGQRVMSTPILYKQHEAKNGLQRMSCSEAQVVFN